MSRLSRLLVMIPLTLSMLPPAASAQSELIPRKHIFGNPTRTSATISPDGRQIAFLAPREGVMNVWVASTGAIDQAKPVTEDKQRPIRTFFWSPDSARILYIQDKGGNENWMLYGVELSTGKQTTYTDFDKAQVRTVSVSPKVPGQILIGLNNRNPQFHDIHRLDLATGQLTLVRQNDEYVGFLADWDHNLAFAQKQAAGGGLQVDRLDKDGKATVFAAIPVDDNLTTGLLGMTADGRTAYMRDSRNRNTGALVAIDLASGKTSVLGGNEKADVDGGAARSDHRRRRSLQRQVPEAANGRRSGTR